LLSSLKTSASCPADKITPLPRSRRFISFFIMLLINVAPRPETRQLTGRVLS
jgi:hypothetical protein